MTTADYAARVEAGAVFLDEHSPGWADRIYLGTLDIANPFTCVLAQGVGMGDYNNALILLGLRDDDGAAELGFTFKPAEGWSSFSPLTAAWREYIARRREGGA